MKLNRKILFKTVTALMAVTVLLIAIYIMLSQKGLVEGYDFGVGAYYYVDVPDFDKIVDDQAYCTTVPVWMHVVLFIAWGWLMWRLWLFIDKK